MHCGLWLRDHGLCLQLQTVFLCVVHYDTTCGWVRHVAKSEALSRAFCSDVPIWSRVRLDARGRRRFLGRRSASRRLFAGGSLPANDFSLFCVQFAIRSTSLSESRRIEFLRRCLRRRSKTRRFARQTTRENAWGPSNSPLHPHSSLPGKESQPIWHVRAKGSSVTLPKSYSTYNYESKYNTQPLEQILTCRPIYCVFILQQL